MFEDAKLEDLQCLLKTSNTIYKTYQWLLDSYVLDFYVKNHWKRLPKSWSDYLNNLEPEELACLINPSEKFKSSKKIPPLSLIALRTSLKLVVFPRYQKLDCIDTPNKTSLNEPLFSKDRFNKSFWKRVKLKKKHEIELMSKLCYKQAVETNCTNIIDVGSGLGHLSRLLSYRYGLKVCSLELQDSLSERAKKLDKDVENAIKKIFDSDIQVCRPTHINMRVDTSNFDGQDILKVANQVFGSSPTQKFGIVGLHPCGDLGTTLLRFFVSSPHVQFINIVGCCYMKLTTGPSPVNGFPLSRYCKKNCYNLSYPSRENACHAIESYIQKLNKAQLWELKVHAYRASLEKLIVSKRPDMSHSQICSVKYSENLTFSDYCVKALSKFSFQLTETERMSEDVYKDLLDWKAVVTFYSLRLMLAPIIETMILLDRLLTIKEMGYECKVISLFDPELSPRNQVVTAIKSWL